MKRAAAPERGVIHVCVPCSANHPLQYRHAERLYVGLPTCGWMWHVCVCMYCVYVRTRDGRDQETVNDLLVCQLRRETVTVARVPEASPTARGKTTRDERRQK